MADRNESEESEEKAILCQMPIGCGGCGIIAKIKDNKIISMRGNREFPNSRGHVCKARFPHLINWLGHPDQLMYPLKRVGERGENKWARIGWDEALDEISDKLEKIKSQYGPESLVSMEGIGDVHGIRGRFLNLFGNPANVSGPGSVCNCNKRALHIALTGSIIATGGSRPVEVYLTPDCIVFAGLSLAEGEPFAWHQFRRRLKGENRPKVIVVDPRRTTLADNADIHLQIRPGTDTALFMAWINVIIEEGLYDKDFVDKWTYGFDELKRRASEYSPERVAEITWISPDKIRECARIYARSKSSSLITGLALDLVGLNGLRAEQARLCLEAITGNLAKLVPGRPMGPGPVVNGKMAIRDSMLQLEDRLPIEMRKKQIGSDRFKLMAWPAWEITSKYYREVYNIPQSMSGHNITAHQPSIWRSILSGKPYPVKAMITWTTNPLVTAANTKLVYEALKSPNLELHVVLEHFMTPTALLADYVLPAASKYEKPTCSTAEDFAPGFRCGERAIRPMGERHTDYEFFRALAQRLGLGEYFPWETDEELADYRLAPVGTTFKHAATVTYGVKSDEPWTFETINPKTGKPTGFATPSGKVELYSNVLKELGYDPLPFYEEPPESPIRTPDIAREYPLILTTCGRVAPHILSMHRQFGMGLREQHPEPLVEIHPDTAREMGIADGDWTCIETRRGVIRQKAFLSAAIHPRVVKIEDGWWFPEQPAEEPSLHGLWQSNANVLTLDDPDACDRLSGGYACSALLCRVYKAPLE